MAETQQPGEHQEDVLGAEILSDARRRAERSRQRAEREAEKIVEDAQKEAASERERILRAARERAERERRVSQARAEQDAEILRREALSGIVARVKSEAEEALAGLAAGQEHRESLIKLAALAVQAIRGDCVRLVLREEDYRRWADQLPGAVRQAVKDQWGRDVEVQIAEEPLSAPGGLVVRSGDGRQVADQTYGERMRRLWDEICGELLSRPDWAEMVPHLRQHKDSEGKADE